MFALGQKRTHALQHDRRKKKDRLAAGLSEIQSVFCQFAIAVFFRFLRTIDAGHAIPTILVTAYPNEVDRVRALNDGVVCCLRKPVDEQHLKRCLHAALTSSK